MATGTVPLVPLSDDGDKGDPTVDAALQRPWRKARPLSSAADLADRFLERAAFDRAPWLAVALAAGIAAWFALPTPVTWLAWLAGWTLAAIAAAALWAGKETRSYLRRASIAVAMLAAFGLALVWARSELVGAEPLARPQVSWIDGRVLAREDRPAEGRVRLTLAYRDAEGGMARKIRVNVSPELIGDGVEEGARIRLRARLMPPGPPMVPGAYDFARTAWFAGLAATGSAMGPVETIEPAPPGGTIARAQRALSAHVHSRLDGSAGAIAAAFASGDRGGIAIADEEAMRDSGLTHLLSISGVHVSAVIAAAYVLAVRLLALWPWLVLRVRLPLVGAAVAAGAGIAYTLLTGAEVPTVRSCVGALLVLIALALGREPLSMRMVATAAFAVLLVWPEALVGPSFQMSFSAVIAIVALHEAAPVRAFLAPREERWIARAGRRAAMLLLTGLVIEIALMPIVLFHFHRAGFYGALANVVAIPLVTFISMPLIALALFLDLLGLGAPIWWLAGQSLELLLAIARFTADQPGAVRLMPQMGWGTFALFIAGGLWLALWRGKARLLGLVASGAGAIALLFTPTPDVLVSDDGRHVGIVGEGDRLLVLREGRSDFARDNLLELAGLEGDPVPLERWPDARCSADFCSLDVVREGRTWTLLMARSRSRIEERSLAAACEKSDIVVADRFLPMSCRPRWLKADRRFLSENGGLAVVLRSETIETVAAGQGQHPWWTARGR
ncbi:ComEC family competence protein [Tsuneonella dongtanensis]|uniref:ComEC family competence protein n=1 Tax=Tsuneonella dongtanensis TaxID=692370 RepID=A0A1B2AEY7_9SPHN|nr:ComEC/Rec2 family competence protein [Tsuneonella dongtanensis]ANY20713.1 ComEC family competence protein [Tsuneonella dongtanensis]